MRLIDTRKDLVFLTILVIYLYIGIYVAFFTDGHIWLYNIFILVSFGTLTLCKVCSKKFRNWLETKL